MQLDERFIERYNLRDEDINLTMRAYTSLQVKTNMFFLEEGRVCPYMGYVTKGLLRSFFYDDFANEITSEFYPKGSLIISFDSFNNQVPSKENIKAIKDSELMVISYAKQKELYEMVPAWNQICKDLADLKSREMIERANQFQTMTATGRYQKFCSDNPEILKDAPLGHIASYLGVDIATLSRIRKKK